jgi:hypothetical protein
MSRGPYGLIKWGTSRDDIGRDVLAAWDAYEACIFRAGEVVSGRKARSLLTAFNNAAEGGYINPEQIKALLGVRADYLLSLSARRGALARVFPRPRTRDLRATRDTLRELEADLRRKLGPQAPASGEEWPRKATGAL